MSHTECFQTIQEPVIPYCPTVFGSKMHTNATSIYHLANPKSLGFATETILEEKKGGSWRKRQGTGGEGGKFCQETNMFMKYYL